MIEYSTRNGISIQVDGTAREVMAEMILLARVVIRSVSEQKGDPRTRVLADMVAVLTELVCDEEIFLKKDHHTSIETDEDAMRRSGEEDV